ncbi:MAG: hypothetical protein GXY47_03620 [Acidobacteria bacterium]|nr:hypothetical protein [Acidobacteriota bacterium]
MHRFTPQHLNLLTARHESPCVSLYQSTHRHRPLNQQDPVRYRNLLREMDASLCRLYPARDVKPIMEPFEKLSRDDDFWSGRTEGIALFAAPGMFQALDLQQPVPDLLIVADSFHIKPLLRIAQSADRYQVLCLTRREASLYEGNRDALDAVELKNVPSTLTEALGEELTEPHQTVASYGQGSGGTPMRHGHGSRKDEVDTDTERFFRVIDRGILEHYSQPSGLPLMLAALPEYHTLFRSVSRNPQLLQAGITTNPDALTPEQLRTESLRRMEPLYQKRIDALIRDYQEAKSRRQGSDDLPALAAAAAEGRIATLLVEAHLQVPGRILSGTGEIRASAMSDPDTDDVLDDLAEHVLRTKGEVVVIPGEEMPTRTGAAAIYRY